MGNTAYLNEVSDYMPCRKKDYRIHFCIPQNGTVVLNRFEQAATVFEAGSEYFTAAYMKSLSADAQNDFLARESAGQLYIVRRNSGQQFGDYASVTEDFMESRCVVLAGTQGEMWTISVNQLLQRYTTPEGNAPLTVDEIKFLQANPSGVLKWRSIKPNKALGEGLAQFIPQNQQGTVQTARGAVLEYNSPLVPHGYGDFIVYDSDPSGNPVDPRVVNGIVFRDTYDNTRGGVAKYLDTTTKVVPVDIAHLPEIWGNADTKTISQIDGLESLADDTLNNGIGTMWLVSASFREGYHGGLHVDYAKIEYEFEFEDGPFRGLVVSSDYSTLNAQKWGIPMASSLRFKSTDETTFRDICANAGIDVNSGSLWDMVEEICQHCASAFITCCRNPKAHKYIEGIDKYDKEWKQVFEEYVADNAYSFTVGFKIPELNITYGFEMSNLFGYVA